MSTTTIRGIPVSFPFTPYQLQVDYMEKVIECLQEGKNGVLESPTGTGKTLSLLCASLSWLEVKRAQIQAHRLAMNDEISKQLNEVAGQYLGLPTIIYASRTHTQLSQAMQEMKRSGYGHMRASIIGSREQMCIHPDISKESSNSMKVHQCRLKVKERSCNFFNKVEKKKDDPVFRDQSVIDIEDLVKLGQSHKFCPYYMAKELKQSADIVFTPYNYLLDPRSRKSLGLELNGNIVILDEGHNIEKVCEESASLQIKSSDISLCIDEVTVIMKALTDPVSDFNDQDVPKDFTAEELCALKEMFLKFEKELDEIPLTRIADEGTYFGGCYIFEILGKAGIVDGNFRTVTGALEKMVQFLATNNDGPYSRKGVGLQLFSDLLLVAFGSSSKDFKDKLEKCYKVHICVEEVKKRSDDWLSKATRTNNRVLSYWCFSPGFGMNMLMDQGIHCVILTSGTLAPLRPLISELELNVGARIENPHIVKGDQICVKIIPKGPDREPLICNYQNRENPNFLLSLGQTFMNLIRGIPHGVLIFFPSYPIMLKCQTAWQKVGIWSGINDMKPILVEPKDKASFTEAMNEYYAKIQDPEFNGAVFMGVCRGKVSEGLDFADINGRAVFIVGLPYPPLKDPKIILKKRYLDHCNSKDAEYLKGDDWYSLEATRAINQAIGRVIRHKDDYGAIFLLDSRFNNPRIQNNLSKWLREHIKTVTNFGVAIREVKQFFRNAQEKFVYKPKPTITSTSVVPRAGIFDFSTSTSTSGISESLVNIHKRKLKNERNPVKKQRIMVVSNPENVTNYNSAIADFIVLAKKKLSPPIFTQFIKIMSDYKEHFDLDELKSGLDRIFLTRLHDSFLVHAIEPFIRPEHKEGFTEYCDRLNTL